MYGLERKKSEKTGMVAKGLFVTSMSVVELYNTHRMGPIFGKTLVSGRKVARAY